MATVTIDQNVNMGRFTSLGVFVFDTTARVELSSNGVEFWRCVAFDVVKFVPVKAFVDGSQVGSTKNVPLYILNYNM